MDTIVTKRHKRLVEILVAARKQAGIRQTVLARSTGKTQTFVVRIEDGQRRIDVIELLALCKIIGIDAVKVIRDLLKVEGELWPPRNQNGKPPPGIGHRRQPRASRRSEDGSPRI